MAERYPDADVSLYCRGKEGKISSSLMMGCPVDIRRQSQRRIGVNMGMIQEHVSFGCRMLPGTSSY